MEPDSTLDTHAEQSAGALARLNQVTPLSKYLAMVLFILLPFVGGYMGYQYGSEKVEEVEQKVVIEGTASDESTQKGSAITDQPVSTTSERTDSDPHEQQQSGEYETILQSIQHTPLLQFVQSNDINTDSFTNRVAIRVRESGQRTTDAYTAADVVETHSATWNLDKQNYESIIDHYRTELNSNGYRYVGRERVSPIRDRGYQTTFDHYFMSDNDTGFVLRSTQGSRPEESTITLAYVENFGVAWEREEFPSPSGTYMASITSGDAYELECGYLNSNCFFEIKHTETEEVVFASKLNQMPILDTNDGQVATGTVMIADVLWSEDEQLYLVSAFGDGGYWSLKYLHFDVEQQVADEIFSAAGGECPSNTYSLQGKTYWLQDTGNDYDVCLDSSQETDTEGYEVYLREGSSQNFEQVIASREAFRNQYLQSLPPVIFEDYKSRTPTGN